MAFDIHRPDDLDDYDEEAIYQYQDELHQLFLNSPEGQAFVQTHPDMGFWSLRLIDYGCIYTTHLTEMDKGSRTRQAKKNSQEKLTSFAGR